MEDRPTIKNAELGHTFTREELNRQCLAIHGAVSWPGKRPGFIVVIGMGMNDKMYLLEEYESESVRDLVRKCGALNFKFHTFKPYSYLSCQYRWFGNYKNDAASQFIGEMNQETKNRERLSLNLSSILDMSQPYQFMLDKLGEFLKADEKCLFLKESKVKNYLSNIESSEISNMELGEYPAIEAVAMAAIELQNTAARIRRLCNQGPPKSAYNNNTLTRGLARCGRLKPLV